MILNSVELAVRVVDLFVWINRVMELAQRFNTD